MVTQGTSWCCHLMIAHKYHGCDSICPVSPLIIHPTPFCLPYVLFIRAHDCSHNSFSSSTCILIMTLFPAENPATCVFFLLISDTPFTDGVVFSIQGQHISHIFIVQTRCWHAGILSQLANNCSTFKHCIIYFSSLICQWEIVSSYRWKSDNDWRWIETQMSGYCSVSSSSRLKLPAVAKNKNNTKCHCCKTDMLEEEGTSKGNVIDNLSAVTGECVVVLRCVRNSMRCTCFWRSSRTCLCATLPWQTVPSHSKWEICWPVQLSATVLLLVILYHSSCFVSLKWPIWGQLIWPWPTALSINI